MYTIYITGNVFNIYFNTYSGYSSYSSVTNDLGATRQVSRGLWTSQCKAGGIRDPQRPKGFWPPVCVWCFLYLQHLVQLFAIVAVVSKATEFYYYPFCCAD